MLLCLIDAVSVCIKGPTLAALLASRQELCWVTAGLIDNHTHYDAEIELSPALAESVRHGVTTITSAAAASAWRWGPPRTSRTCSAGSRAFLGAS